MLKIDRTEHSTDINVNLGIAKIQAYVERFKTGREIYFTVIFFSHISVSIDANRCSGSVTFQATLDHRIG